MTTIQKKKCHCGHTENLHMLTTNICIVQCCTCYGFQVLDFSKLDDFKKALEMEELIECKDVMPRGMKGYQASLRGSMQDLIDCAVEIVGREYESKRQEQDTETAAIIEFGNAAKKFINTVNKINL